MDTLVKSETGLRHPPSQVALPPAASAGDLFESATRWLVHNRPDFLFIFPFVISRPLCCFQWVSNALDLHKSSRLEWLLLIHSSLLPTTLYCRNPRPHRGNSKSRRRISRRNHKLSSCCDSTIASNYFNTNTLTRHHAMNDRPFFHT